MPRSVFVCFTVIGMAIGTTVSGADLTAEKLQIHPHVFGLVTCWPSDSEQPVVTEINLDAVSKNRNQFDMSTVKTRGAWIESPGELSQGFERYRIVKSDNEQMIVEYQSNGGGTYTSASTIEFVIELREFRHNGKMVSRRILRVVSCETK